MIVGAIGDDDLGNASGSASVFRLDGRARWSERQKLIASDGGANEQFGGSVAIDGHIAAVAAQRHANWVGAVYVFEKRGRRWREMQKLVPGDGTPGDEFGVISMSGRSIAVGSKRNMGSGSVYIYDRFRWGQWVQSAKLLPSLGDPEDLFGVAVSLHRDLLVVGAPGDDDEGPQNGAVYVFDRARNGSWVLQDKIFGPPAASNGWFGSSVATDGDLIAVGGSGLVSVFARSGSATWRVVQTLRAQDFSASGSFGTVLAINSDLLSIGDPTDSGRMPFSGAVYIFGRTSAGFQFTQRLRPPDQRSGDFFGSSVGISRGRMVAGSRYAGSTGAAHIFSR